MLSATRLVLSRIDCRHITTIVARTGSSAKHGKTRSRGRLLELIAGLRNGTERHQSQIVCHHGRSRNQIAIHYSGKT